MQTGFFLQMESALGVRDRMFSRYGLFGVYACNSSQSSQSEILLKGKPEIWSVEQAVVIANI
jgi:hypothetical protein